MFNDIGPLEILALVILAVIVFGPDKLPKVIQDGARLIRKVREFSENAKEDIRSELGPEFKDFEFEDLNPKTFVRKQIMENDDFKEIRSSLDLRKEISDVADMKKDFGVAEMKKEMAEVADAVHGRDTAAAAVPIASANGSAAASTTPDLLKKREEPDGGDHPPFDADAT
ncbi:sec-independent translocase [Streptomyces montanisoli]|uniref:Sec-independent protein translocase protein TatB n=1 Tax=Streptomyces montanisoli TaxID=2798581 RepID=A0A940S185_9ACTN|nr:sec-independent translocase [Streptomyces montanisoli]MBP0461709.1 Sec-independent protein translocase subunit TatB [Streptomyces montanisoli]